MRSLSIMVLITMLVLAPELTPLHAAGLWDVSPTPLDQMQDAGVATNVGAISKLLADADQDVQLRYWAAMALGQLADNSAIPVLVSSLSDSDAIVRAGAAAALGYMPDNKSVPALCKTALSDVHMAPRHNATTSLGSNMTDEATNCMVRVAANEQETRKVRLQSLIILEQQIAERSGFEELIPTLEDPDPNVKGMAAVILSLEYEQETQLLESLSVIRSVVEAATDPGIVSWVYIPVVERLEDIAGRRFIDDRDADLVTQIPEIRTGINERIKAWTAEEL